MSLNPSEKKIAFAGPWISDKEVEYVTDATRNGFYDGFDRYAKKLEKTVSEYIGVNHGIATHCCTVALHLACATLGLTEGDEVICTDFSWIATAYAISYTGAIPVFVDIDRDTWTIDPAAIANAITSRTKAIMVVHSFGIPADMTRIMQIAKDHRLKVIEDAAPAIGAEHRGQRVGSFGDVSCFSFQGAKLTVSGEGGIFLTNSQDLFEKATLLASMGRTNSKANFWSDMLGWQYTIANLTAALALAQVERVTELLEKKRTIFGWYHERLKDIDGIKMIFEPKGSQGNYCYPSILLEESFSVDRDRALLRMKELNVHCRPAFPRMSRMPHFGGYRFENPVAGEVEKRGISLASAGNMDERDVDFACKALLQSLKKA